MIEFVSVVKQFSERVRGGVQEVIEVLFACCSRYAAGGQTVAIKV